MHLKQMKFVKQLLHNQIGSSVAQAAAVALATAVLLGALLLIVPSLAAVADQSFQCLIGVLSGGGGSCAGAASSGTIPQPPPQGKPPAGKNGDGLPPPSYPASDGTRALTPEERALAEQIFGPGALDLDAVRITRDGPFVQPRAYVIGNTIHWPYDQITTATLAHELTHVYQFQRRGWVYLREAAVLQGQYEIWKRTGLGSDPYSYGDEAGLRRARAEGKTFGDFNVEQQGAIVGDYWERRQNGQDTSVYDPFIDDLRRGILTPERRPGPRFPIPIPWPPIISGPWPPFIPGPRIPLPRPPWEWF